MLYTTSDIVKKITNTRSYQEKKTYTHKQRGSTAHTHVQRKERDSTATHAQRSTQRERSTHNTHTHREREAHTTHTHTITIDNNSIHTTPRDTHMYTIVHTQVYRYRHRCYVHYTSIGQASKIVKKITRCNCIVTMYQERKNK